jgi:hypothetical protein
MAALTALAAAALLSGALPSAAAPAHAAPAFDYGGWTDVYSRDDPALAGLGISFKVPPEFTRETDPDLPVREGYEVAWTKDGPSAKTFTGVTFRALFDPEADLSGPHRTFVGAWDNEALASFWKDTLTPMDGYRSHEAGRHRGWPSSRTSLSVMLAGGHSGSEIYQEVEMLMVMHQNVMLVMQCSDTSPIPLTVHERTVEGICTPFFDSLEIEGEAPAEGVPLPR